MNGNRNAKQASTFIVVFPKTDRQKEGFFCKKMSNNVNTLTHEPTLEK